MRPDHDIQVSVSVRYLAEQSLPAEERFVFAYEIRIHNHGRLGARLLSRYWHIVSAAERIQEVRGDGVVGEQPFLAPDGEFCYSSGVVMPSPVGRMQGAYQFIDEQGQGFAVDIPAFTLAVPRALH